MSLPQFNTQDRILSMMQTQWASSINPVLDNPSLKSIILKDIPLIVGATVINHLLQRNPQGWRIVDINGAATIYRSQPLNNSLTLTLTSNAAVVVSLEVF